MAKIDFYTIDRSEKEAIFNAIAAERRMTPFAVEKDWWVSRTPGHYLSDAYSQPFGFQRWYISE
jgi:hypothetical protein